MKRSVRKLVSAFVLSLLMLTVSVLSFSTESAAQIGIGIGISVHIGPPALPVYAQPVCPGPGYLWTPGYWAWNDDGGYYWVPGTWVVAPVGMLWTPGYWGFAGGVYGWHAGYWGPHVGFYGGINYGFGYGGVGFAGGEWRGGGFFYNRAVMNVNVVNVTNVYSRTVVVNNVHTSFNGPGGIDVRPTAQEEAYSREPHRAALPAQTEHEHAASQNRALFASENHGRPAIAATGKPGEFNGPRVVRASAAGGNFNDRAAERSENRSAADREQSASRENAKPSQQEKQAQKNNQKQAKAEAKRNGNDEHR
ncbi:MAG: YXWGXW repeat-containing protein [Terriglobales bacterium]